MLFSELHLILDLSFSAFKVGVSTEENLEK
jgi:hypothetical protein